jgi:Zn ribbon nucleic-acid-binding protein
MGSVLNYIECPNCKHEASDDFYYKTGEEYINCNNCGYHYSAIIINRDKKLSELTESDWKIEELKNPYGAYRLKVYHSIATQCGSFATKYEYDYFISEISKDVEIEFCSISRLIDGKIVEELLINNSLKNEN